MRPKRFADLENCLYSATEFEFRGSSCEKGESWDSQGGGGVSEGLWSAGNNDAVKLARDDTTVATRRSCGFKRYKCRKYLLIRKASTRPDKIDKFALSCYDAAVSRSKCKMPGKG